MFNIRKITDIFLSVQKINKKFSSSNPGKPSQPQGQRYGRSLNWRLILSDILTTYKHVIFIKYKTPSFDFEFYNRIYDYYFTKTLLLFREKSS